MYPSPSLHATSLSTDMLLKGFSRVLKGICTLVGCTYKQIRFKQACVLILLVMVVCELIVTRSFRSKSEIYLYHNHPTTGSIPNITISYLLAMTMVLSLFPGPKNSIYQTNFDSGHQHGLDFYSVVERDLAHSGGPKGLLRFPWYRVCLGDSPLFLTYFAGYVRPYHTMGAVAGGQVHS